MSAALSPLSSFTSGYGAANTYIQQQNQINQLNAQAALQQQQFSNAKKAALNTATFGASLADDKLGSSLRDLNSQLFSESSQAEALLASRGIGGKSALALQSQLIDDRDRAVLDAINQTEISKARLNFETQSQLSGIQTQSLLSNYQSQVQTQQVRTQQTRDLFGTGFGFVGSLLK